MCTIIPAVVAIGRSPGTCTCLDNTRRKERKYRCAPIVP